MCFERHIAHHQELKTVTAASGFTYVCGCWQLSWLTHDSFNLTVNNFNMELSTTETKTMAFRGKTPVPSKIFIGNSTLEKVHSIKYPGYNLS
jgi:hypothetical protein